MTSRAAHLRLDGPVVVRVCRRVVHQQVVTDLVDPHLLRVLACQKHEGAREKYMPRIQGKQASSMTCLVEVERLAVVRVAAANDVTRRTRISMSGATAPV